MFASGNFRPSGSSPTYIPRDVALNMVARMFDYMSRPHSAMSDMVTIGHKDIRTGEMTSQVDMPMFGLGVYLMKGPSVRMRSLMLLNAVTG